MAHFDFHLAYLIIIQLNYSLLAKMPSCILIDDIGEGLDYGRSKSLIELIINKAKDSPVQLFMTTNDRFVMNKTSLKYWSIIKREGKKSLCYNSRNSEKIFDEFELTRLSNFNFFSSNYFHLTTFGVQDLSWTSNFMNIYSV
jgi:hypothetical protein